MISTTLRAHYPGTCTSTTILHLFQRIEYAAFVQKGYRFSEGDYKTPHRSRQLDLLRRYEFLLLRLFS